MSDQFAIWGVLELMGHRRLGGFVTEEERFGTKLIRIDVPTPDGQLSTQYYSQSALYCLTPVSEDVARAVALRNQPQPVHQWELPAPRESAAADDGDVEDDDGYNDLCEDDD